MILENLPAATPIRLTVGSAVRKPPDLLRAHLNTLSSQILPPRVSLTPCMVDDNEVEESSQILRQWCEDRNGIYLDARTTERPGFSDTHPITHQWSGEAMRRVGQLKNHIFRETLTNGYQGCWLVDADLILSPRVLWSLFYSDALIVCGVFWTRWQNVPDCQSLPQVWLRHPYQFDGRGLEAHEFLRSLTDRKRVQVWGQGACTLYRVDALSKGLSFELLEDLPKEGMWLGEDRHLCTRAERMHIPMYADAWPDIWHAYHLHEQGNAEDWRQRLAEEPLGSPKTDDLVSLHTQALEPVQTGPQQWHHLTRYHARGRLGRMDLVPEVEAAVREMVRGESRIISVQYPLWSASQFRGQRKLIQVTLLDWKTFSPPVGL